MLSPMDDWEKRIEGMIRKKAIIKKIRLIKIDRERIIISLL